MTATAQHPHYHRKNSTIVRTQIEAKKPDSARLRVTRASFRALSAHTPGLAARWAEHLFLTARRHERPFWEYEAIEGASAGRIDHEGSFLPTWTWPRESVGRPSEMPTVILVHGWEGRGSQLATFVPKLLARGLRVVTFDAPGHGDSPLPRASVVEHARALVAVAKAVGSVHAVIGHSVGGAAALFATRLGLEARRFALVSPPTTPSRFASLFAKMLGLDPSVKKAMLARLEERYAIPFDQIDARIDAHRLAAPLLVVHDREDPIVQFEEGLELANIAPRGQLVETTGLGHRAILRAPCVVDVVTRFVAEDIPATKSFAETLDGELYFRDRRWQ